MSFLVPLAHVTAYTVPQIAAYMMFAFGLGLSVAVVLQLNRSGAPADDNE